MMWMAAYIVVFEYTVIKFSSFILLILCGVIPTIALMCSGYSLYKHNAEIGKKFNTNNEFEVLRFGRNQIITA